MAVANVVGKLNLHPGGLADVVLYGKVRCLVEKPSFVGDIGAYSTNGGFAILDVFSIKCMRDDWFRDRNTESSNVYWSKGSVLFYLDKVNLIGKVVKVAGKSANTGVKLKKQRGSGEGEGYCAFVFAPPSTDKGWQVKPNFVQELGTKDTEFKITEMHEFALRSMANDGSLYENIDSTELLDTYVTYNAINGDYIEIDPDSVSSDTTTLHKSNEKIDLSKVDLKLMHRLTGIEKPDLFYDVENEIEEQAEKRKRYANTLVGEAKIAYDNASTPIKNIARDIVSGFTYNVAYNYSEKVGASRITGRYYVEELIKCFSYEGFSKKVKTEELDKLKEDVIANPDMLLDTSTGYEGIDNKIILACMIIGFSTGIGYIDLIKNYRSLNRIANVDMEVWLYMLLENPYRADIMGSGLSIPDADVIYFSYTRHFLETPLESVVELRKDLQLLKGIEDCCVKDSLVSAAQLRNCSYKGSYPRSQQLNANGFPLRNDLVELLKAILGIDNIKVDKRCLNAIVDNWFSNQRVEKLIDEGLVDTVDDKYMLEKDLEKEFLIFKVFQEMGTQETGITDEQCDEAVEQFEEKVGFKLEPLQKDGVKLTKYRAAVLSGCAGSGKTTTSDAMVICLSNSLPKIKQVYCAPTGKASRRLAEVVEGVVKTVHSEFRVGVGVSESYLTPISKSRRVSDNEGSKCYLVDEAGMLNRDLLYEIARNIKSGDIIYFLGDIKQLPPIGVGVPFFTLMNILPCVELGVSKRAAEGSLINYNTTLINCLSDGIVEEIMFDDSTFIKKECADLAISKTVVKLWKDFMTGNVGGKRWEEKDIQVISGYASPKFMYSSTSLNPHLQRLLRKDDKLLFRYGGLRSGDSKEIYKNERVIHTNLNLYGTPRYVEVSKGVYEEVASIGIINGEMGTVVGCYASENLTIVDFEELECVAGEGYYANVSEEQLEDMLETREAYEEKLISMNDMKGSNIFFVMVKVFDVTLKRDVIVMYDAYGSSTDGVLFLRGQSIENLELAYALTCHKMQGSQTPVAIIPIGSDANPDFINRNMLNTMITRSQEVVGLVGTIDGLDSPLNKGRRVPSKYKTECLLNYLCGII